MYRIRRASWPSSVTWPPPSITTSGLSLKTFAVAAIVIVTGFGPQSKVMTPPLATALTTAAEVQLAGVPLPITWSGEDESAAPAPGGTGALPSGLPGAGCAAVIRVMDLARWRKPAVSARLMSRFGQNRWLPHEIARPAVARRLIAVANGWCVETSSNRTPLVAVSLSALVTNTAMRPRVTAASGQKRRFEQPAAIPAVTTLSMAVAFEPCFGTSRNRTPLVAVRWNVRTR